MSVESSKVVFLLGAGRSGTTLLYKLLSLHSQVAYLSNYQNRYPNWPIFAHFQSLLNKFPVYKRRTWFKDEGGAYFDHRQWLHSIIPTPSEAELFYAACDIPLTPSQDYQLKSDSVNCLRNRFEKIRQLSQGHVLLSKRTANNRRIPILREIFPTAKYIHLIRDGRAVAYSLLRVEWWDDHILYWANQSPKHMVAAGSNPLELAARNWVEEMQVLERGIAMIPKECLLEVRYEELLRQPSEQLMRIFDFMEISALEDNEFWETIKSLNLQPKQEKWMSKWSKRELDMVLDLQGNLLHHWGYK